MSTEKRPLADLEQGSKQLILVGGKGGGGENHLRGGHRLAHGRIREKDPHLVQRPHTIPL